MKLKQKLLACTSKTHINQGQSNERDSRSNSYWTNKTQEKADEATETNHNLNYGGNYDGPLDLKMVEKKCVNMNSAIGQTLDYDR